MPTASSPGSSAPVAGPRTGPFPVAEVVDGDTIKVSEGGTIVTVRLIGIDTPETRDPRKPVECFGKEASGYLTGLLTGQPVELESDPSQGTTDKYGRTLAYVYRGPLLVNQDLLERGYAAEYTYDQPYRYQAAFRTAEVTARTGNRGLWSPTTCAGDLNRPVLPTPDGSSPPVGHPPGSSDSTAAPGAPYFPSCAAARAAGAAPLHRGDAGYRSGLDGDGDGVACE